MHIVYMNAVSIDLYTAYISHVSHITSFALANIVLEKEREDKNILNWLFGEFGRIVRLFNRNSERGFRF